METLEEFEKAIEELTPYQKRVLKAIERAPGKMANTWEICWNDFAKEWNAKRSGHGAMFRSILQAGQAMQAKGIIVILTPRDQYDTYTYASLRPLKRAQQSVSLTASGAGGRGDNPLQGLDQADDPSAKIGGG